ISLRGVAPQRGQPLRAFIHEKRLYGVSDRSVSSFALEDRDHPTKNAELALAAPAFTAKPFGNYIASLTNDWWTGEEMLSLTARTNIEQGDYTGVVSLRDLARRTAANCTEGAFWAPSEARIFVNEPYIYVATMDAGYSTAGGGPSSDPALVVGIV